MGGPGNRRISERQHPDHSKIRWAFEADYSYSRIEKKIMKLLAYDTSSEVLSAAIFDGARIMAEFESPAFTRHSSVLVPSLEKLLKGCRMSLAEIDVLAVGLGPGSFTGLRVGITTAKIIAYVCGIKLIGVSSLEAVALGKRGFEGEIAVILDAKKDKLYAGVFEIGPKGFKVIQRPRICGIDALLKKVSRPRLFLGNGVKIHREAILKTGRCCVDESAEFALPKAVYIAERAMTLAEEREWSDPFRLEPLYLHP